MRIIDVEDSEWTNQIPWRIVKLGKNKTHPYERIQFNIALHDMVISPEVRDYAVKLVAALKRHRSNGFVDHVNNNTFDNRR